MSPFLAAGAAPTFFTEAAALIVAGALVAYVCQRLRLVPIVGFLLAGVLIGPNALGLVRDRALVDAAAEVGVILLLFAIGIEFSLGRLARIKKLIFAGGGLQVGLAVLLTAGLLAAFGAGWRAGLFTGFLVALSSTAIVLKVLADKGETGDAHGQVALGLLIFQDLAVVVMVLLVPTLGGAGGGSGLGIVWALAKAGGIIAAVLVVARRVMPRVLESVARTCSPEIFLLTVVAICFGTAYLTSLAGVSLSLGAFLAGLLVSESRFSEHAFGEILPLQILFSAAFFISVGMLLDVRFLVMNLPLVAAAVALVLAVKLLTTAAGVLALGYRAPVAAASGLALAQVGEFSFVLERSGRDAGLSPGGLGEVGSQTFIAATVVLMVLTPLLMQAGSRLARKIEEKHQRRGAEALEGDASAGHAPDIEDHVIVAGYGQAARRLVRVLSGSRIPYVITTLSPEGANEAEGEGHTVLRGDAGRQRTLQLAGVERAKMVVVADDEPAAARRVAAVARTLNPTARILVRTRYMEEAERLTEAGADRAIAEELESVVALFSDVLRGYQIPVAEIDAHEEAIRRGGYAALLRDRAEGEQPIVICSPGRDCFDRRTFTVRAGSPVTAGPLSQMFLDAAVSIKVLEVVRGGKTVSDPPEDFVTWPGDELTLEGSTEAFTRAAHLFRGDEVGEEAPPDAGSGGAFIDTERVVSLDAEKLSTKCTHLAEARPVLPSARGCEDCLRTGDTWVHLRLCMTCGHVGCCDSSKNRHATRHHTATGDPIIKSLERGEDWAWCYPDETYL
ncbi:MAG TPA: cation:proton antiporter [Pyrinomonadaceae bacterium]|jgi:CPA2 family monovalent cation:H+ antiporter-2|nr:cation:proton antiporter [Pyrinomonadaceae bacterium]